MPKRRSQPNRLLTEARRVLPSSSGAPGVMSRQELAEAVNTYLWQRHGIEEHLDRSDIGRLERGEVRWPGVHRREALRAILDVASDSEIGLYPHRVRSQNLAEVNPSRVSVEPSPRVGADANDAAPDGDDHEVGLLSHGDAWWEDGETIELIGRVTQEDLVGVDRRQASRTLGVMVVGTALLEPLDRWFSAAIERAATTPRSGPRKIGDGEVAQLEQTAILFRRWDDRFGGGLRRKAVIGQLNEVAGLLDRSHGAPIDRRLLRVLAQLAETAATMLWDSGNGEAAQRYYLLALRAATEGDDPAFAANVMAGMARQLLYLNHTNDAVELVRLALDVSAGQTSATVRAMLYTRLAWAYAKQGRLTAFRRTTDKAQHTHLGAEPANDPLWISYFGPAELAGVTGGRLLELAHRRRALADEAAEHIQRAVQLRGAHHLRSMSLDLVGAAEARLLQGEVEEACRVGLQAVQTAAQTTSDRVRIKLTGFYRLTHRHRRLPQVATLRDQLRPLITR